MAPKLNPPDKEVASARVLLEIWDIVHALDAKVIHSEKLFLIVCAIQSLPGEVLESISAEIKRRKSTEGL
jgi:hypothetical protein